MSLVVLKANSMEDETMSKIRFEAEDTIFDVQKKILHYIDENRKYSTENSTDKMIDTLTRIPGILRVARHRAHRRRGEPRGLQRFGGGGNRPPPALCFF